MLVNRCAILLLAASCLTSAFSTRFVVGRVNEGQQLETDQKTKTEVTEEKNLVQEEPLSNPETTLGLKIIPIVTDVFTEPEDLLNMTPLKLVTAISAQHLLTVVRNIPVSGNSLQDNLDMLGNIIKEFNKTTEVMKLTAQYVNISSHYILSVLNQFSNSDCDLKILEEAVKTVRNDFLKTVVTHIIGAVKELSEKSRQRELSGSDILSSSAFHIVTAFQEMTNKVIALTSESNEKCSNRALPTLEITPPSHENIDVPKIPEQGQSHMSIKKDEAVLKSVNKITQTDLSSPQDDTPLKSLNNNQDLTIEVFSPEVFLKNNKDAQENEKYQQQNVEVPKESSMDHLPLTITLFRNTGKEIANDKPETSDQVNQKELEKEPASSTDDNSSNARNENSELEMKESDKMMTARKGEIQKIPLSLMNVLEMLVPGYESPLQQPQHHCDERADPVCGIDKDKKKFIIFLNDCKRDAHNKMYGTAYAKTGMNSCLGLYLRNQNLQLNVPSPSANQQLKMAAAAI